MIGTETFPFAAPENCSYAVLFDVNLWQDFVSLVGSRPDIKTVFVVTDSMAQFQQISAELPGSAEISMLYEDYLRNFEMRVGEMS